MALDLTPPHRVFLFLRLREVSGPKSDASRGGHHRQAGYLDTFCRTFDSLFVESSDCKKPAFGRDLRMSFLEAKSFATCFGEFDPGSG